MTPIEALGAKDGPDIVEKSTLVRRVSYIERRGIYSEFSEERIRRNVKGVNDGRLTV